MRRERLFEIIEAADENDRASNLYDILMMITIVVSMIPLAFKKERPLFVTVERVATVIFSVDYLLRLYTADYKVRRGKASFLIYPFTPMALIDLLCILPSLNLISGSFRVLKILRLLRTFRVLRVFKAIRYSRKPLLMVCFLAVGYVIISALVIFNAEPETFDTFFDAVYWATVSLTTMGYGDITPVTDIGRLLTMISAIFGIAIIALPSGIITAGIMEGISRDSEREKEESGRISAEPAESDQASRVSES